jgi:hypothetical protein
VRVKRRPSSAIFSLLLPYSTKKEKFNFFISRALETPDIDMCCANSVAL